MIRSFLGIALLAIMSGNAYADYVVTAQETGGDVVFTGSGSIDATAWTFLGVGNNPSTIRPSGGIIQFAGNPIDFYAGPVVVSGPSNFGVGGNATASSSLGPAFGFSPPSVGTTLYVPEGYVFGTPLGTSTMTFDATDFATLGITPGTYTWSWGSGGTADTLTLNVVPEPSGIVLFLGGIATIGLRRRRDSN